MQFHMGLWTIIWQFLYVLDGALIKSSIIWTLLRLAKGLNKNYTRILWVLFAFAWITWQISWPVAIFQCKPVAAAWGEPGDCTSGQTVILNVSYFVSAANIFTDISTSLVPAFLLRHVQIPSRLKIVTIGILSLGVLASVATTIRITYTWAYTTPHNRYCKYNFHHRGHLRITANVRILSRNWQDCLVDCSRVRPGYHRWFHAHAAHSPPRCRSRPCCHRWCNPWPIPRYQPQDHWLHWTTNSHETVKRWRVKKL